LFHCYIVKLYCCCDLWRDCQPAVLPLIRPFFECCGRRSGRPPRYLVAQKLVLFVYVGLEIEVDRGLGALIVLLQSMDGWAQKRGRHQLFQGTISLLPADVALVVVTPFCSGGNSPISIFTAIRAASTGEVPSRDC
jgi:hypothetical protein